MGFGNFLLPIRVISDEINLSCDLTNMNHGTIIGVNKLRP